MLKNNKNVLIKLINVNLLGTKQLHLSSWMTGVGLIAASLYMFKWRLPDASFENGCLLEIEQKSSN